MRAVDTNVLVRLIARDDSRQVASAESFVEKGAWVPFLMLAEAAWVLATIYDLSSNELARAIEMLLNHRDLVLQDAETVAAALDLFRAKPALGFPIADSSVGPEGRTSSSWYFRPETCQG